MRVFTIILLAAAAIWVDVALSFWWPNWLIPIWIWIGICIFVMRQNSAQRWLWVVAIAAWGLFISSVFEMLMLIVIFGIASELLNIIYKRYLPMSNTLLMLIPSAILLSICQVLFLLATGQLIGWLWLGRVVATTLILAVIIFFYDPQKAKKKYF